MTKNDENAFVRSIDTLHEKEVNRTIPPGSGWRGSKPFFENKDDSKKHLKKMCRKGIPATLRQAVWLTNVKLASDPNQPKKVSYKYAQTSQQDVFDSAWNVAKKTTFPHGDNDEIDDDEIDVEIPDFGLGQSFLQTLISSGYNHFNNSFHEEELPQQGTKYLQQILLAVQAILGVEYCPLLPDLTTICLTHMSVGYTYTTIRTIVQSLESQHMNFVILSKVEHYSICKTFADTVRKMHPQLSQKMDECGALSVKGLDPIFKRFFTPLLKFEHVLRAMDIFTIEGSKFMIRFGIGLLEQCKDIKYENIQDAETWWSKVRAITHSRNFRFDSVIQQAYGFRGIPRFPLRRLNKCIPSRSSINQMIQSNEKIAKLDIEKDDGDDRGSVPAFPPIDYINNGEVPSKLVKPTSIRSHLAEWLPLGLKSSKLDLIFSTDVHGRTLERFYSHCDSSKHTILLLEVLQTGATIGMYASQPWHVNSRIYGDGTCFLFRAKPNPRCFKWKGGRGSGVGKEHHRKEESTIQADGGELTLEELALVEHFMDGKDSHIGMGINRDGGSGLWLNEDLTKGSSSHTVGFENEPLAGTDLAYFDVGLVEVYRLVREIDGKPY